ncbi:putative glycoside hydrolase [Rubritalea spongiae]|uniref:Glycoside hydrolase n=1 Tax=Rubritalea spongiae TaxID=430797 RepID=A0ABW5E4I6_9BACT
MKIHRSSPSRLRQIALTLLACGGITSVQSKDYFPKFSWDRVPVMLHFGSQTQMTDEQVQLTAKLSNFVCLEKNHGVRTNKQNAEKVAGEDARRIKAANPNSKVLMYWNTLIAWPFTSYNRDFAESKPKDWTLRNMKTGEPLYKTKNNGGVVQYNLLNPEVQEWCAKTIGSAVKEFGFDGYFLDAVSQSKRPIWLRQGWGMGKEKELDQAAANIMKRSKEVMGEDKLLIYNGFRTHATEFDGFTAGGGEFLPYTDGAMIEHFDSISSKEKEDMVAYWKMGAEAAKDGKIVIYKGWPDQDINWLNKEFMALDAAEKERIARENLVYPLACFLIGAHENSYFCYGWGYNIKDGQLVEYPEYSKKLGAPISKATRDGWIFKREFKHAKVTVDLENRKANIEWLN